MHIVILSGEVLNPGDISWDVFTKNYEQVDIYAETKTREDAIERIKDTDVILGPGMRLTGEILAHAPKLKYIGTLSTGYDMIDLAYCKEKGIVVTNIPSYGTEMVSQYAISLLLEICGQVGYHSRVVHEGKWAGCGKRMFWDFPIIELAGKTMGIIGFGRIGKNTARIAQALGMNVVYADKFRSEQEENERCVYGTYEDIYAKADVVILHCPLFPETANIINKDSIAKMKDGVIIINNARGALVAEEDLAAALKSGKVYAAGLDVTPKEPLPLTSPLMDCENCFITPHISWVAKESRMRLMGIAADNLKKFLEGTPVNTVI